MALTIGSRLGVYDVTAPIGEGGMGQVYRARDTKLDRDVAQWVGFGADGKVNKISVEGGAVVPLGEVGTFIGASWAEDGSIFVSDLRKGLLQFPAAGGAPTIVAPFKSGAVLAVPQLLPGGTAILFAACSSAAVDNCNIEVLTLVEGRRKILARGAHDPRYLPSSNGTGHLVYDNKATLFAIPFELATLETRGTAVQCRWRSALVADRT